MAWAELAGRVLGASMKAFGTPFTYWPKGAGRPAGPFTTRPGSADPLQGVWDEKHSLVEMVDGAPISTTAPVLGVHLMDLPVAPLAGDEVDIAARHWRVVDPQPDGQGGAKLILELMVAP